MARRVQSASTRVSERDANDYFLGRGGTSSRVEGTTYLNKPTGRSGLGALSFGATRCSSYQNKAGRGERRENARNDGLSIGRDSPMSLNLTEGFTFLEQTIGEEQHVNNSCAPCSAG